MNKFLATFQSEIKSNAYEYFGAFVKEKYTLFRVWAPNAECVSVVGDFNAWKIESTPMKRLDSGIWEAKVKGIKQFDIYKYAITNG